MSRRQERIKRQAADASKVVEGNKFIAMPAQFNQGVQTIIGQANAMVQQRILTAQQLRDDIPDGWLYNVQRGGFIPPKKETPDAKERKDQG